MRRYFLGPSILLVFALAANAQRVTNSANTGHPENGLFQGTDVESVQLNNLNLHIEIPVWSTAGRGPGVGYKYAYDNKKWEFRTTCTPQGVCSDTPTKGGKLNIVGSINYVLTPKTKINVPCPPPTGASANQYSYQLQEPDGTKHHFAPDPVGDAGNICGLPSPDVLYATDGSGWIVQRSTSSAISKDGTQVVSPLTDRNGNQITYSSLGAGTDTLGKTVQSNGSYYGPDGVLQSVTVTNASVPVQTALCTWSTADYCGEYSGTFTVPQTIQLANGMSYNFTYAQNSYGEPVSMTLPAGGQVAWTWTPLATGPSGRSVATRTVTANGQSAQWSYTKSGNTITMTDPAANDTKITCVYFDASSLDPACYAAQTQNYSGSATTGTLLKTVATDYQTLAMTTDETVALPIRETTTWNQANLMTKVETDYDSVAVNGGTYTWRNVVNRREYDWGAGAPGALLRSTHNEYLHLQNAAYKNLNIADKATSTTVYDGAGTQVALTYFDYDQTPISSAGTTPNHNTSYSASYTTRGNLSGVRRWLNTTGTYLTTTNWYDELGNILQTQDPGGHLTYFDYTDVWSASPCAVGGATKAFVTTVTNALGQQSKTQYNSCTSLAEKFQDQNDINAGRWGKVLTFDKMFRVTQVTLADGGQSTKTYNDTVPYSVRVDTVTGQPTPLTSTTIFDGLGRVKQTQLNSDPEGVVFTDTTYDSMGRVSTVSNPYRSTSDPTYGITKTVYDALGRPCKVIPSDGTDSGSTCDPSTASNIVSTVYSGNTVTVTDQAGKQRRTYNDGAGRLVRVDEPTEIYTTGTPATSGTGSAAISGAEQSTQVQTSSATGSSGWVAVNGTQGSDTHTTCSPINPDICHTSTTYHSGTFSVTVGGMTKSYGWCCIGASSSGIATNIASLFNGDGSSPVNASVSGSTITFTSRAVGSSTNYAMSWSSTITSDFYGSQSGANMTGGSDAGYTTVNDSGNVTATVNGFAKTVSYGAGSTSATIANALYTAFLNDGSSPVNITLSGSTVTFTAKATGASTNYSLSSSSTYNSTYFAQRSFTTTNSGSTLTGGADAVASAPTGNWSLATPAITNYTYDALNNLKCVEQQGTVSGTGCASPSSADATSPWRVRRFTYDSLSRLTDATNPESGHIGYAYNSDGILTAKTDARGITLTYGMDALHRVTNKTYSNADPGVAFSYDSASATNGIGRRTGMSDASGSTTWGYDALGRETLETRTIAGITKQTGRLYKPDGSLWKLTYPSGEVIEYSYNTAARAVSAADAALGINYATIAMYAPSGAVAGLKNGATGTFAGITTTNNYNKRLQPVFLSAASPTQTLFSLGYDFKLGTANNGNVSQITNNLDGTRSQSFTYDGLNRIKTAQTTNSNNWGNSYVYDAWGNLLQKNPTKGTAENFSAAASGQNMLVGYAYDAAGNMTTGVSGYDAENRITAAGGVTYTYDGDGTRVKKSSGTLYWGIGPLAESDLTGNINKEFIFFNGQRTAMRKSSGEVDYYFADHLGSSRVLTNATGTILDDQDFFPFGGTASGSSTSPNNYKFTGKERDSESGLDYFGARYYGSSMGRWLTPDWSDSLAPIPYATLSTPQTLNLYSYVDNNPTTLADSDGHIGTTPEGDAKTKFGDGTEPGFFFGSSADCSGFCLKERMDNWQQGAGWQTNEQVREAAHELFLNSGRTYYFFGQQIDSGFINKMGYEDLRLLYLASQFARSNSSSMVWKAAAKTLAVGATRLTGPQATSAAEQLGYQKIKDPPFNSKGQPVFKKGNKYITPDADGHSGGVWKMFNRKGERLGTYDANLNKIGP